MFVVVGLGNPGVEYEHTRHNVGRIALSRFLKDHAFPELVSSGKYASLISEGAVGKEKTLVMFPETFMNKSGSAVKKAVASKKQAEKLIVVHDDIDLPFGSMKISVGRGSGGHNGVASVIRSVGTKDFVRIRVGVAPATPSGNVRKPKGEQKVVDFLMGDFKKAEEVKLKHVTKNVSGAVEMCITDGVAAAMNAYN